MTWATSCRGMAPGSQGCSTGAPRLWLTPSWGPWAGREPSSGYSPVLRSALFSHSKPVPCARLHDEVGVTTHSHVVSVVSCADWQARDILPAAVAQSSAGSVQVLLDVGAGLGFHSLAAAARGHQAIAFELSPNSHNPFNASIAFNGYSKHITLHQVCHPCIVLLACLLQA